MFKIFALLESAWNLLQSVYDITHLTLGMLLHYLEKLKIQIFCRYEKKRKNASLIASNFVIHRPILIFSVFKIANLWLQIKFSVSLFFYLFTFAISLWHRKFVTADVTVAFVNNQHGIQRRGQDFDKKFLFEGVHSRHVYRQMSWERLDKSRC